MDLSRDDEGATQDRSNAPITTTNDPEQVKTYNILDTSQIHGDYLLLETYSLDIVFPLLWIWF